MDMRTPDWDAIRVEGTAYSQDEVPPLRFFKSVSPRLFETSGTRLVAGRDFTWTDLFDHRHVVMVSENLARELWGTPAGADRQAHPDARRRLPWREVIGVVQDVYDNGVSEPAPTTVYWPSLGENSIPRRTSDRRAHGDVRHPEPAGGHRDASRARCARRCGRRTRACRWPPSARCRTSTTSRWRGPRSRS